MVAAYYVGFSFFNVLGVDTIPSMYKLFAQAMAQPICQIIVFFNIFISIGAEVMNKLQIKMNENSSDSDPLVEVFSNVESLKDKISNLMGSSVTKSFKDYTERRDELVKAA